jgi:hypothetical protein
MSLEVAVALSDRPRRYPHQLPARIEPLIVGCKRDRPHWGAHKIRELLVRRLDGDIRIPAALYRPARSHLPQHDREVLVTARGRICMHRKPVNISTVLAGQRLGIKEVDDGIWIVSFMHYDLGFIDLQQKTLQPSDNPLGPRMSPTS